jgi:hypothetical protein
MAKYLTRLLEAGIVGGTESCWLPLQGVDAKLATSSASPPAGCEAWVWCCSSSVGLIVGPRRLTRYDACSKRWSQSRITPQYKAMPELEGVGVRVLSLL